MLEFLVYFITVSGIYALLVLSLNLQTGVTGMINFGNIAYFGIGAYAVGIAARTGTPWWLGVLAGLVVAGVFGLLLGLIGRRLATDYWAIVTLGIAECVRLIALNQGEFTGGPQGINGVTGPFTGIDPSVRPWLWIIAIVLITGLAVVWFRVLVGMQFGRTLRLIREQPLLAESLGHSVGRSRTRMLVIAAALGALGGALYAMYTSFISPGQLMPSETFVLFTMLIIGGTGSIVGSVVGAAIVQFVYTGSRFLGDYMPIPTEQQGSIRVLIIGAALFAFLMFRPEGLIPERPRRIRA